MKQFLFLTFFTGSFFISISQPTAAPRKYPSVLWEITGNGLKQPSYLMGTMHVSNKLAFHLPDSFYRALRSVKMVALETNPETWQDDMDDYEFGDFSIEDKSGSYENFQSTPSEYLSIKTLKFYNYNRKIESALSGTPQTINSLLYRSNGNESEDFEEDTYLDMYIYQCGRKLGKAVAGLENYGESMKLMEQANRDAANEKNKKERSYDDQDERYSFSKLQDAYRSGNLDLLDSINRYNSRSDAYDEKFIYRRNEIQANSIDSILHAGNSLFAGVGAAHLPGNRGVIELLRKKGYRLRPVKMGERDSKDKEVLENLRVPVKFKSFTASDSLYRVEVPGNMHKAGDDGALDQQQYSDMANGSYYLVTRIMTNAWMWGQSEQEVYHMIDSLLYENIPGKIISRKDISKAGYRGMEISNRTRRGDQQRYQVYITPFEVLFFKTGGNGNYILNGTEADQFFNSIVLRPYPVATALSTWSSFSPASGGFKVDMPHVPYLGNDGSWIWDASEPASGTHFRVIRSDIHNYNFAEEDTFDLSLMEESFRSSDFIDTSISHLHGNWNGYPSLESRFRDKRGNIYRAKFIIQGPHYYTLVAHAKENNKEMDRFFSSFALTPFRYASATSRKDTALAYTVTSPVFIDRSKISINLGNNGFYGYKQNEEDKPDPVADGQFRNRVVMNDTTGEKIFLTLSRFPEYTYFVDTASLDAEAELLSRRDSNWIIRYHRTYELPGNIRVNEVKLGGKESSRIIWRRSFYRKGVMQTLYSQTDSLTSPSAFVKNFYDTFRPADTLKAGDPFVNKWNLFYNDFMSNDSVRHKRAVKGAGLVLPDSTDLEALKQVIRTLNWKEKDYLETKEALVMKLAYLTAPAASDHLKLLYQAAGDTVQLQYIALESLMQQGTPYAYNVFGKIIQTDPPVFDEEMSLGLPVSFEGSFLDQLSDSLSLTKKILPQLLPLIDLDDYKSDIMSLLATMVDSNLVAASDYSAYADRFLLEARQELKKQGVMERKKLIEKAEKLKKKKEGDDEDPEVSDDEGNDDLFLYARLLRPFVSVKPAVRTFYDQLLASGDKQLRYQVLKLMVKNKMSYPDSLLKQFIALDEYRYKVFTDLREMKMLSLFPEKYMTPAAMGLSCLYDRAGYSEKPDSIIFLDSLRSSVRGKDGWVWFYKYKSRKDDINWKIAVVGLLAPDPHVFIYTDEESLEENPIVYKGGTLYGRETPGFDMTEMTDTQLKAEEPVRPQLDRMLKKIQFLRHRSAKEFYEENENGGRTDYFNFR